MTNGITHAKGNSLSPESCVLIPSGEARIHRHSVRGGRSLPIVAASSLAPASMDGLASSASFGGGC